MRQIDADHLIQVVCSATILSDGFKEAFRKLVAGEPTVGRPTRSQFKRMAVQLGYEPVVHCKDCKHYAPEIEYCGIHSHFVTRNGDLCYPDESSEWKTFSQEDYCSQGERRDDTDEPVRP